MCTRWRDCSQKDKSLQTIEGILFEAMAKAGAVSKDNADDSGKVSLLTHVELRASAHTRLTCSRLPSSLIPSRSRSLELRGPMLVCMLLETSVSSIYVHRTQKGRMT